MARIRTTRVRGGTRVCVSGRLAASDMRRLEFACREALTREPLHLQLDLSRVSELDASAAALIARFRQRGAQIRPAPADLPSQDAADVTRSSGVRR